MFINKQYIKYIIIIWTISFYLLCNLFCGKGYKGLLEDSGTSYDSDLSALMIPTGLSASDGVYTDKITITWNVVVNAVSYNVHKSNTQDGIYVLLGSTSDTIYTDTDVKIEQNYFYKITAQNASMKTDFSVSDSGTIAYDYSGYTFSSRFGSSGIDDGYLNNPRGIAIDSSGYLYVTEKDNYRVQKFDIHGTALGWYGKDDMGFVGWHEPGTGRTGQADSGETGALHLPRKITIIEYNNQSILFVANDIDVNTISKFILNDSFPITYLGVMGSSGSGDGQFYSPGTILKDSRDNLWLADNGNQRIQKLDIYGATLGWWGYDGSKTCWHEPGITTAMMGRDEGQFHGVYSIAIDSNDYIYACDFFNNRVQKFKIEDGGQLSYAGWYGKDSALGTGFHPSGSGAGSPVSGTGALEFIGPVSIAIDKYGYVLVVEEGCHRVQKFTPSGVFIGWLGKSTSFGPGWFGSSVTDPENGSNDNEFDTPQDILVHNNSIFIVEEGLNDRVQVFSKN